MESKEDSSSKKEERVTWRECPICAGERIRVGEGYHTASFNSFLGLVQHVIEHQEAANRPPERMHLFLHERGEFYDNFQADNSRPSGRKPQISPEAKRFLPVIAAWLEQALRSVPAMNEIQESSLLVADQLVKLVGEIPNEFSEQRDYLQQHEEIFRATGQDPDWPKTPGLQAIFMASSMAGAQWGLKPSSSREYVRQEKPKLKGAMPILSWVPKEVTDGKWWEVEGPEASGEEET